MNENIRSKAADMADKAKHRVEEQYNQKREAATSEIHHLASALRTAADNVRNDGGSSIGSMLLTRAAEKLETLGSSFSGRDLDGIMHDVERLARRNPAAFIGGAMLVGFAASRFLKSSRGSDGWDGDDLGGYREDFTRYSDDQPIRTGDQPIGTGTGTGIGTGGL